MSTPTLTHWKKLTHPDYFGAYALEPGKDMILTIKSCAIEIVQGADGKKQECMVIHFMENGIKPMICNKTNAKTITKVHKTPYIEQWTGKQIQLYAAPVSAFGTTTDALRIREIVPAPVNQIDPSKAIAAIYEAGSLDSLKAVFSSLSKSEASHPDVIKAKDARKGELTV